MNWRVRMMNDPRVKPNLGGMYAAVTGRSFWPLKAAVFCGVAVAAVPLLVGALAGVAVGAVVYAVGSALDGLTRGFTSQRPTDATAPSDLPGVPGAGTGRENVRVIPRP